jgi:hypothetical protein
MARANGIASRRASASWPQPTGPRCRSLAGRFKKDLDASLKSDKTVDKATREAAVREADELKSEAKELASVIGDGRPASGEARALLDRAARIRAASSGRTLSPSAQSAWRSVEGGLATVAEGFSLPSR